MVRLKVTEQSAQVMPLVEGMTKWRVAPTMTRGSKACYQDQVKKAKVHFSAMQVRKKMNAAKAKKVKKDKSKQKKEKKEKKAKPSKQKVSLPAKVGPESIRRTSEGRSVIRAIMKELYDLDCQSFPQEPCFNAEGFCRVKFDGANTLEWSEMLDNAPACLECVCLCCSLTSCNFSLSIYQEPQCSFVGDELGHPGLYLQSTRGEYIARCMRMSTNVSRVVDIAHEHVHI